MPEDIIDPDLPIIDPHHHLWDRRFMLGMLPTPPSHAFEPIISKWARYELDEMLADMCSGHNVQATVFVQCTSMHRIDGPEHLKPVGETEYVNGIAAATASGVYGPQRIAAGIVGHVDLTLGADHVGQALDAHIAVSGGRFRGIRHTTSWDDDPTVLGPLHRAPEGLMLDPAFRDGFALLAPRQLSFDAWLLEPQLPDLIDLARAFPDTRIVLDHVGTPLGIASYDGRRDERFDVWRNNIRELSKSDNVFVKLGGLAMPFCNFPSCWSDTPASSEQLATEWRPYIETCIEAFGPGRAMFESNFPVDHASCDYPTLWNAMKRIASGATTDEKADLFFNTANRFYRLGLVA
ncbi:MAG: amidohydrolase family protein [Hyphomonadaceae bacterium]